MRPPPKEREPPRTPPTQINNTTYRKEGSCLVSWGDQSVGPRSGWSWRARGIDLFYTHPPPPPPPRFLDRHRQKSVIKNRKYNCLGKDARLRGQQQERLGTTPTARPSSRNRTRSSGTGIIADGANTQTRTKKWKEKSSGKVPRQSAWRGLCFSPSPASAYAPPPAFSATERSTKGAPSDPPPLK